MSCLRYGERKAIVEADDWYRTTFKACANAGGAVTRLATPGLWAVPAGDRGLEGAPVIGPTGAVRVMVATKPVDFRKGAEGLAALVGEAMGAPGR